MTIRHILQATSLAIVATTVVADGMQQQRPDDGGLYFSVLVADYYDVEYLQAPTAPARYVVFRGERLALLASVGNRGSVDEDLEIGQIPVEGGIGVEGLGLPPGSAVPRIIIDPQGRQESRGAAVDAMWGAAVRVPSRGEVKFRAHIDVPETAPSGVYELQFTPRFSGRTTAIVPLAHILRFEVRSGGTFEERVEIVRRRMFRHYNHEDFAAAEADADALLEMYPTSWVAYEVKGRAAGVREDLQRAVSAYQRARELLTQGEDRLWLAQAPQNKVKDALDLLTDRIQSVGKAVTIKDKH